MDITITINTDNAAFEDNAGGEIARILRVTAAQFEENEGYLEKAVHGTPCRDFNGNTVGRIEVLA